MRCPICGIGSLLASFVVGPVYRCTGAVSYLGDACGISLRLESERDGVALWTVLEVAPEPSYLDGILATVEITYGTSTSSFSAVSLIQLARDMGL